MTAILLIIKNWKASLAAGAGLVIAVLWGLLKFQSAKRAIAEHKNKAFEKAGEINKAQVEAKKEIDKQEEVEIYEELHANKSKSDSIDNW